MEYYEKNKEQCKAWARNNYHKNKLNPESSCYIEHRLELQKKAYLKKHPDRKIRCPYSRRLLGGKIYPFTVKRGYYLITF
jgi:hypothetical protein